MALFEYLSVALSLILFYFFHDASTERQKNLQITSLERQGGISAIYNDAFHG